MRNSRKFMHGLVIAGVMGTALLGSGMAAAEDGTITITGSVTATTCKISGSAGPASIAVKLPDVSNNALSTVGAVSGRTRFDIQVSGCADKTTKVSAYFPTGVNTLPNGHLKNTAAGAGAASGIGVQLLNGADFSVVDLSKGVGAQNSTVATIVEGKANLPFAVEYIAEEATIKPGNVSASLQFTLQYQ